MGAEPVLGHVEPNKGSFISLGPDKRPKTHITKVGISNGLTWSLDNKKFYYIDTPKGVVEEFDFDIENGTIGTYFSSA